MTRRRSPRAKRNMRNQMAAQVRLLSGIVTDKYHEYLRYKRYRKWRLPGQAKMEKAAWNGFKKAQADLLMILRRQAKLKKEGNI